MAYTTPRTWTTGELVTAAFMNTHLRDNLLAGFPTDAVWEDWTPTLANITQGNGTVEARYQQEGKTVHAKFLFTFGSSGSAVGTAPTITLPVTAASEFANAETPAGTVVINDANGSRYGGPALPGSTTVMGLFVWAAGASHIAAANITSSVPMTWASTDSLGADFVYEAA